MSSVELREEAIPIGAGLLEGMSIVVSAPPGLASKLATGLRRLGSAVALQADPISSRDEAVAAFAEIGRIDALIHAPPAPAPAPFAQTDEEAWVRGAEDPIWHALVLFQAAYAAFGETGGGSIVAVLPSITLTGAAGLVPFTAAAEGTRQLVKSAARAWGPRGTRVNCLTLPVEEWGVTATEPVPNRYGASLPGANAAGDIAGAAALLISPLASGVTGATVGVDRGTVLAP
jgi:3-oxoacyl-[acyl-carrier protein] reductase